MRNLAFDKNLFIVYKSYTMEHRMKTEVDKYILAENKFKEATAELNITEYTKTCNRFDNINISIGIGVILALGTPSMLFITHVFHSGFITAAILLCSMFMVAVPLLSKAVTEYAFSNKFKTLCFLPFYRKFRNKVMTNFSNIEDWLKEKDNYLICLNYFEYYLNMNITDKENQKYFKHNLEQFKRHLAHKNYFKTSWYFLQIIHIINTEKAELPINEEILKNEYKKYLEKLDSCEQAYSVNLKNQQYQQDILDIIDKNTKQMNYNDRL